MRPTKSCVKTTWSSEYMPSKKQVHFTEDTIDPRPSAISHTLENFIFAQPEDMAAFDSYPDEPVAIRCTRPVCTLSSSPVQIEQVSTCAPLKSCLKKPKNYELHAELSKTVKFNEALEYDTKAVKHERPRPKYQPAPGRSSSQEPKQRTKLPDGPCKSASMDKEKASTVKRARFTDDEDDVNDDGSDTEEFSDTEEYVFRIEDMITSFRVETAFMRMREQEARDYHNWMYRSSLVEKNKERKFKRPVMRRPKPILQRQRVEREGLRGASSLYEMI